jgi:uridine kinase
VKIYVDTPDDLRFIRRLQRDISERGRTLDSVINQYMETVRPMHEAFVSTSKIYADIIVPEGGENKVAVDILSITLLSLINSAISSEEKQS